MIEGSGSRVTVVGTGELSNDDGNSYAFPLPPSLSAIRGLRRLTVTLGWNSPINPQHRNYRKAALWVSSPQSPLLLNRTCVDYQAARRGTVQHEVFEGEEAVAFAQVGSAALLILAKKITLPDRPTSQLPLVRTWWQEFSLSAITLSLDPEMVSSRALILLR